MKVYAHRGSSLIWPENTLLAFNLAHQAGATGCETDLRLSKDDQIVLSHDDHLARLGHPDKNIHQLTAQEISKIEITSPDGKFRDHMITLRTLLQTYPDKDYIFDCKLSERRLFEILKKELAELNFHNRIWFLTWSREGDNHVREHFPGYHFFPRVFRSHIWGWTTILGLGTRFEPKNQILSLPAYHLDLPIFKRRQIASIQRRGKIFLGYLVNTDKDWQRCREFGVEMVLTDRVDLIASFEN